VSKKNLAGTIVEGGQSGGSKVERREANCRTRRHGRVDINEDFDAYLTPTRKVTDPYLHREFADKLRPLARWLRAQVGRPANDVWSDLCRRYDRRKVRNWHMLEGHAAYDLGMAQRRYPRNFNLHGVRHPGLYVDDDGILRYWSEKDYNAAMAPIYAAYKKEIPEKPKLYAVNGFTRSDRVSKGVFYSDLPANSVLDDLTEPEE
jgi:hypothetical protein